jgi:hypothetical protein
MTGAGKSYTMFGDIYHQDSPNSEPGLVILTVNEFFAQKIKQENQYSFSLRLSYIEIYNEQVRDLLTQKSSSDSLMLVEDPVKGVIVSDLTEYEITDV